MKINATRLQQHIEEQSLIGKLGETGLCRPAHSPEEKQVFELAEKWMQEAGMKTRIDHFGNLIGRLEGSEPSLPVLMMGSHLDTQPYGGRFDGVAGVLSAIEAVATLTENGIIPKRSIEVISFADEEGWRFNKGLFGSRGILGKLEPGELQRADKDGITRAQALTDFGCDINRFAESEYKANSIYCFLELHIEQGPVLESINQPIGIVSGISGPLWWTVKLNGMAGHTGSVPMHMRKDPMLAAAKVIVALNEIVTANSSAPTVGSVASMRVFPNSRNIIPEMVEFTVDLRDIDIHRRNICEQQLRAHLDIIVAQHQLTCEIVEDTNSEPRYCATWIREMMHEEAAKLHANPPELMSGPFHDALALSYACDYAMIFIRSKDGISHNPLEFSSWEDLSLGADLLYATMCRILEK